MIYVSFKLKLSKVSKDYGTIYARVSMNGERKEVATFIETYTKYFKNNKFYGENADHLNNQLMIIKNEIENIYNFLRFHYLQHDAETITKVYNGKLVIRDNQLYEKEEIETLDPNAKKTFLQMYSLFLRHKEVVEKWSAGTIKTQLSRHKNILEFLIETQNKKILPEQIKSKIINDFSYWGLQKKKWSKDYLARHIELFKNVIEFCISEEIITYNPIIHMKVEKENRRDKTHLSTEELQRLEDAQFNKDEQLLEEVRDIFVFMAHTGMNISDYLNFAEKPNKFIQHEKGLDFIIQNRQKLRKRYQNEIFAMIPIDDKIKSLLFKYKYKLPIYTDSKINEELKKIGIRLGISLTKMKNKVARKTFANEKYNSQIDIRAVSAMMGHTKTSTTELYYTKSKLDFVASEFKKATKTN